MTGGVGIQALAVVAILVPSLLEVVAAVSAVPLAILIVVAVVTVPVSLPLRIFTDFFRGLVVGVKALSVEKRGILRNPQAKLLRAFQKGFQRSNKKMSGVKF